MSEPDWTAQLDQLVAGMADLAKPLAALYRGLVAEGVEPVNAVQIAAVYMATFMAKMTRGDDQ